jgi:hypothetical protein
MQQAQIQQAQQALQIKQQELQLKQEMNQLKQAELVMKAQQAEAQNQIDVFNKKADIHQSLIAHGLDKEKLHSDQAVEVAKILSGLHQTHLQHDHEANMGQQKHQSAHILSQQKALKNMQEASSSNENTEPDAEGQ